MHPIRSTATVLACLAALALLVSGCGGSSDPGVAKLATTAASSTATAAGSEAPGGAPGGASASSGGGNQGGEQHSEAAIAGPGGPEAQKKMVAFAQCIRSHGVPDFPEPSEGKLLIKGTSKNGLNPGSPQFQAAMKACRSLAPAQKLSPQQTAAMQAQALKFSECMRSHGVPNFPDPKFEGGGVRMSLHAGPGGINPQSPQFQAAQKACQGDLPGPKGGPRVAQAVPAGP
ncbi:MAG TPA: hypothetical protein VNV37_11330 [Solirubrobacteraceae bacterium]|jgi:hypothetical protein|nr:hypothetical protein [Solirubrobacteraceae bacterium]